MSQAMVLANEVGITSMHELKDLARMAAASKLFNFTPEQALMLMMTGRDLGFSYAQSMRMFYVVNGKPTLSADAMVAVCLSHKDVCEYFVNVSTDDKQSTWETKRVGTPGPQRYTFTIRDAEAAGLLKKNPTWSAHPTRMLRARAKAFLARDVYPELLAGLSDEDEAQETVSIPAQHGAPVVVQVPDAPVTPADEFQADIDAAIDDLLSARSKSDVDAVTERLAVRKPPIPKTHPRRSEIVEAAKAAKRMIAEGQALAAQQQAEQDAQDAAEAAEANADGREPGSDG